MLNAFNELIVWSLRFFYINVCTVIYCRKREENDMRRRCCGLPKVMTQQVAI